METVPRDKVLVTLESRDKQGYWRSLYFRFDSGFCVIWKPPDDHYVCCAVGPIPTWGEIEVEDMRIEPSNKFTEEQVLFLAQKAHTIEVRPHEIDIWG